MSNKLYEFLTADDISSTNAGDLASDFYSAALDEAVTLNNGGVTMLEGITYKHVLPNITVADPVAAASCTFADGDNITVAERVLTLTDLKVNEEVCISALVPHWKGYVREASRHGIEEPRFIDYIMAQIARAVGQSIERGIWRGTAPYGVGLTSNDGTLDEAGIDASIFADFVEYDITTSIASEGVLTVMDGMLQGAITGGIGAILDKPGAGFYLGRSAYWQYANELSAAGSNQGQTNGEGFSNGNKQGLTYQGFPIYMCPGMFDNTAALTYPENINVGTSAGSDFDEVRAIDMRETNGDDTIRAVGRFQLGCQVGNAGDGVLAAVPFT